MKIELDEAREICLPENTELFITLNERDFIAHIVPEKEEVPVEIPRERWFQWIIDEWREINPHWRRDVALYRWGNYFQKNLPKLQSSR